MNNNGSAGSRQMFKIRRKSTGKFFTPGYRTVSWNEKGKVYATFQAATSAARQCSVDGGMGKVRLAPSKVEVVEFALREVNTYQV
jgi:hypothetical protein